MQQSSAVLPQFLASVSKGVQHFHKLSTCDHATPSNRQLLASVLWRCCDADVGVRLHKPHDSRNRRGERNMDLPPCRILLLRLLETL
eukprot:981222-Amphidinium_carterae.4